MSRPAASPWGMGLALSAGVLVFLLGFWAAFVAVVGAIVAGIASWGTVDKSVWDQAIEVVRWFLLICSAGMVRTLLPVYVAHGQTRREFTRMASVTVVLLAAASAVLVGVGFGLENLLYRINDWPETLDQTHLYASATDFGPMFVELWSLFLAWMVTGAFLGAGFYRSDNWGVVLVPAGVLLVGTLELTLGTGYLFGGLLERDEPVPLGLAVAVGLVCLAAGLAVLWAMVRDVPLRSRTA